MSTVGGMDTPTDRWTPVHKGDTYCSPRCGCGCTRAAYERAVKEADELAAKLGLGWQPNVWENCGWYYSAVKGEASVHPNTGGGRINGTYTVRGYTAFLNFDPQTVACGASPEDALGSAIQSARSTISRLMDNLSALTEGLGQ